MSLYIATLAQIKLELGIADNTEDAHLLQWAQGLQGRFERRVRRPLLYSAAETERFDGDVFSVWVTRSPIVAVASVHVSPNQSWDADSLLDPENEDYRIDNRLGRIFYGASGAQRWPLGRQNIRVVYSGGMFTAAGEPASEWTTEGETEALRAWFLMQLGYEWRNRVALGIDQLTAQGMSKKAPAALLKEVDEGLRRFEVF
jgi:hypothetical protein